MMKEPLRLYLDQNFAANLSDSYHATGRLSEQQKAFRRLHDTITGLVDDEKLMVPISLAHCWETHKRTHPDSKQRLQETFLSLSRGRGLGHFTHEEALNLFKRLEREPELDLWQLSGMVGIEQMKLGKKNPKDFEQLFALRAAGWFSSPEEEFRQFFHAVEQEAAEVKSIAEQYATYTNQQIQQQPTPLKQIYTNLLSLSLDNAINTVEVTPQREALLQEHYPWLFNREKRKEREELLATMPSHYCFFRLEYGKRDKRAKFVQNDFFDCIAYASAIPYTDIVAGEKNFISLAQEAKLDQRYGTELFKGTGPNTLRQLEQQLQTRLG